MKIRSEIRILAENLVTEALANAIEELKNESEESRVSGKFIHCVKNLSFFFRNAKIGGPKSRFRKWC